MCPHFKCIEHIARKNALKATSHCLKCCYCCEIIFLWNRLANWIQKNRENVLQNKKKTPKPNKKAIKNGSSNGGKTTVNVRRIIQNRGDTHNRTHSDEQNSYNAGTDIKNHKVERKIQTHRKERTYERTKTNKKCVHIQNTTRGKKYQQQTCRNNKS